MFICRFRFTTVATVLVSANFMVQSAPTSRWLTPVAPNNNPAMITNPMRMTTGNGQVFGIFVLSVRNRVRLPDRKLPMFDTLYQFSGGVLGLCVNNHNKPAHLNCVGGLLRQLARATWNGISIDIALTPFFENPCWKTLLDPSLCRRGAESRPPDCHGCTDQASAKATTTLAHFGATPAVAFNSGSIRLAVSMPHISLAASFWDIQPFLVLQAGYSPAWS
jgi:hypothetical protein